jgi:hypothetical protein
MSMSDYNQDVRDAKEAFKNWENTDGDYMVGSAAENVRGLLEKYDDERGTCLEQMARLLELKEDNLSEKWQKLSEWGLDLLDHLDRSVIDAVKGSDPDCNGLRSIGLKDFAEGEKKIWLECHKATCATMADVIFEVEQSDTELIKKLEEDLKKAYEGGKLADELTARAGYTFIDGLNDAAKVGITVVGMGIKAAMNVIGVLLKPAVKSALDKGRTAMTNTLSAAKDKRLYKGLILDNKKMIDDLKDKINDGAIETAFTQGVSFAQSLRDVGSTGNYKAADWEKFGAECATKLKERSEPALERAEHLFKTVQPALIEGLSGAFATIASSIDDLEKFKGQLDAAKISVYEALAKDDQVLDSLDPSHNKDEAKAALQDIRKDVAETIQGFYDALKEAQDSVSS